MITLLKVNNLHILTSWLAILPKSIYHNLWVISHNPKSMAHEDKKIGFKEALNKWLIVWKVEIKELLTITSYLQWMGWERFFWYYVVIVTQQSTVHCTCTVVHYHLENILPIPQTNSWSSCQLLQVPNCLFAINSVCVWVQSDKE